MIGACHADTPSELANSGSDALVVGRNQKIIEIAGLLRTLPHVLEHGLAGKRDESFSRESGGGIPGGNYPQNPRPHN
jgi:hypothetical protein